MKKHSNVPADVFLGTMLAAFAGAFCAACAKYLLRMSWHWWIFIGSTILFFWILCLSDQGGLDITGLFPERLKRICAPITKFMMVLAALVGIALVLLFMYVMVKAF